MQQTGKTVENEHLCFLETLKVGGAYPGFPWIIQSMIQTLKTLHQTDQWESSLVNVSWWTLGEDSWKSVGDCEVWSWQRESVSGRGELNESFVWHRQSSNCVLATVWNKCTTIFAVSLSTDTAQQSPFIFVPTPPPHLPSLLTRWSHTLSRTILSDLLASGWG